MPHYKDGQEARVGDTIKGKPYNTPYEVVGVVAGITPDTEACNLRVAFAKPFGPDSYQRPIAIIDTYGEPPVLVDMAVDYGETRDFELVDRRETPYTSGARR